MLSSSLFWCLAFSVLGTQASALPHLDGSLSKRSQQHSNAVCEDYEVPVTVTSENIILNITIKDNYEAVHIVTQMARKDSATAFHPISGKQNVTAEYSITGTFCTPKQPKDGHEKTVLLATHGLAYDRRYWDSSYKPSEYSFVESATNAGFSVFFYDRLGTGDSQKISGFVNQHSIQLEIAVALVELIRDGKYTGSIGKPKSIVLVGHSFGSFISNSLISKYPDLVDGVVLTGIGYDKSTAAQTSQPPPLTSPDAPDYVAKLTIESFSPRLANQQNPSAFSDLDNGYLTFGDIGNHVNGFFHHPNYEIPAVEYAHSIAQPLAIAEFLSFGTISIDAHAFKGPVLVTTGEFDFVVCGGECYSSYASNVTQAIFAGASALETYVHPGAGHGVNLNKNATGFYDVINGFLLRQGF